MPDDIENKVVAALAHRLENGRHLHHRHCIHNLPPEEQVALRRRTPEEYVAIHGEMPVQITPNDWECESPWYVPPRAQSPEQEQEQ